MILLVPWCRQVGYADKLDYVSAKGEQTMEHNYIQEALAHYNITAPEIELLRHNENLTYRVGNEYLLQIHEPVEGFSAEFFTTVLSVSRYIRQSLRFKRT